MKKNIQLSPLFSHIDAQLKSIYPDPILCRQYTWWLLEAITTTKKAQLITQETLELTAAQQQQLETWISQLLHEHKPIQYILGSVPFNGVEILVEPPILIPRPETEEWCINLIEQLTTITNKKINILDLCSGSGCIAIALAKHLPEATIIAADIAQRAITLGKKNATHNNVTNITFVQSDLFEAFEHQKQQFDLIVSNPPYIDPAAWQTLDSSVKNWEDKNALIAPDHGLAIIKKIIQQAPAHLKTNPEFLKNNIPQLVIEIDTDQGEIVAQLMEQAGFSNVHVEKDLEGKNRIVSGSVPHVENPQGS